jgi:hypothetical protein
MPVLLAALLLAEGAGPPTCLVIDGEGAVRQEISELRR